MRFVGAKQADITLAGVNVDIENRDGSIHAVTFTDSTGKILKLSKHNYSDLMAFVIAPPKTAKKFELKMSLKGYATIEETFEFESEASERQHEVEKAFGYPSFESTIVPVEVEVAE